MSEVYEDTSKSSETGQSPSTTVQGTLTAKGSSSSKRTGKKNFVKPKEKKRQTANNRPKNSGYDPRTYLFIYGAKYNPATKTTIEIADEILNTILKLKFRASQIIEWNESKSKTRSRQNQNQNEAAASLPDPPAGPIVAVLPSYGCVQDVIKAGPKFKKLIKDNVDYRQAYESVYFEEFLTGQELPLKRVVVQRVKAINDRLAASGIQIGGQQWGQLKAKVASKTSYKHMGLEVVGKLSENGTKILWTSCQTLPSKSESQNKNSSKSNQTTGGRAKTRAEDESSSIIKTTLPHSKRPVTPVPRDQEPRDQEPLDQEPLDQEPLGQEPQENVCDDPAKSDNDAWQEHFVVAPFDSETQKNLKSPSSSNENR